VLDKARVPMFVIATALVAAMVVVVLGTMLRLGLVIMAVHFALAPARSTAGMALSFGTHGRGHQHADDHERRATVRQ
jgi:hypothetical protein